MARGVHDPVPPRGRRLGMDLRRLDRKWPRGDYAGSCHGVRKTCKNRKFLSCDEKNLRVVADSFSFLFSSGIDAVAQPPCVSFVRTGWYSTHITTKSEV